MRNDLKLKSFDEEIEKSKKNMMSGDVTPVDWLRWGIHLIFFIKSWLILVGL